MVGVIAFLSFLISLSESRISYEGEQVIRCNLDSPSTYQKLIESFDVWSVLADQSIEIRIKSPEQRKSVEALLDGCEIVIDDLEEYVRMDEAANLAARANENWFDNYHTWAELDSWYQNLTAMYPSFLTYTPIGTTYQGNTIKVLKISVSGASSRPNVYMQAQIHAREWIAAATANYIINQLVEDYLRGVTDVVNLLQSINLHLVPVLNIDGYLFTWSTDRLWRKNRSPAANSSCLGTDINRNYNDHWGQGGSSSDPCSETYMGSSAASERETQASQNYFKSIQQLAPVLCGIDWHSYSQLVLRPYGWTKAPSPDEPALKAQGDAYAATILATSGANYTSQQAYDLYATSGTARDWFYGDDASIGNQGYRSAGYTIELRPQNNPPGFRLPPIEIIPTGNENYRALVPFLTNWVASPLYYPQSQ